MDGRDFKVAGTAGGLGLAGLSLAGPLGGLIGLAFGAVISNSVLPEKDAPWHDIAALISEGETTKIEFKSSLLNKNKVSDKIVCTLAGMANTKGGNLLIGVDDCGSISGIEKDFSQKYKDRDQWLKALTDKISSDIGGSFSKHYRIRFEDYQDQTVCQIEVRKTNKKIYCKGVYYIRQNNQTTTLNHEEFVKIQSDD